MCLSNAIQASHPSARAQSLQCKPGDGLFPENRDCCFPKCFVEILYQKSQPVWPKDSGLDNRTENPSKYKILPAGCQLVLDNGNLPWCGSFQILESTMHWRNMTLSTVVMVWKKSWNDWWHALFLCFVYKPIDVLFAHRQRQWHGSLPPLWWSTGPSSALKKPLPVWYWAQRLSLGCLAGAQGATSWMAFCCLNCTYMKKLI